MSGSYQNIVNLIWLALVTDALIVRLPCKQYADFNIVNQDYVLNEPLIRTSTGSTQQECEFKCLMNQKCKSINYQRNDKRECQLISKTPSDIRDKVKLEKKEGWTFTTTNYSEPLVGENCKNINPCKEGVLCKDTCTCPGYQCYPCEEGRTGIHCEAWTDCVAATKSNSKKKGIFLIQPHSSFRSEVVCSPLNRDLGWIVIQRRLNENSNFTKNWSAYKYGFGTLSSDFWIGLENLHRLTTFGRNASFSMRFVVSSGLKRINYENFAIGNETDGYRLTVGRFLGGTSNNFVFHNKMKFSTSDRDNDLDNENCARKYGGGWWYKGGSGIACLSLNPNGHSMVFNKENISSSEMMIKFT